MPSPSWAMILHSRPARSDGPRNHGHGRVAARATDG
jgi:hypothetical protein